MPTPRHAHHLSHREQGQLSHREQGRAGGQGQASVPTVHRRGPVGAWQTFSHRLVADAEAEQVNPTWAWWIFWTPALGGVIVALTFAVRPVYYWLLREDHTVEWLQFALCVLAAVSALLAAARLAGRRQWPAAVTLIVMALGCLGLAGEEISWGQRVFGFAASGVAANRQGELNLHNVSSQDGIPIEEIFRIVEMFIGLVGAVLPLLTRWQPPRLRGVYWRTLSPPLFLTPGFLAVFGYRFFRLLFPAQISAVVKYQEWAEVCLYGALALMAVLLFSPRRPGPGHPEDVRRTIDLRVALVVTVVISGMTVLFAVLTTMSGIAPGNV